jgi:amino-acid N-acetyltransferase
MEEAPEPENVDVRPARVEDVPQIHALIKCHAERGKMILRPLDELYANLREFVVSEKKGRVLGCAAAHVFWSDLAELKCLAVDDQHQGRGVGRALCQACEQEMRRLGVARLFTLTSAPGFFEKAGYRRVDKDALPRFIWGECIRCPSFPVCNEEALVKEIV